MFCDAEGCSELATYLRVIKVDDDRIIKFNLCEKCNKLNWKVDHAGEGTKFIRMDQ